MSRNGRRGDGGPLPVHLRAEAVRGEARLCGALEDTTAARLDAIVDQLVRDGCCELVLDLAAVDFMGAAGLRVLVRADDALRAAGGRLVLRNVPRMVRRVLAITELDRTFTVE